MRSASSERARALARVASLARALACGVASLTFGSAALSGCGDSDSIAGAWAVCDPATEPLCARTWLAAHREEYGTAAGIQWGWYFPRDGGPLRALYYDSAAGYYCETSPQYAMSAWTEEEDGRVRVSDVLGEGTIFLSRDGELLANPPADLGDPPVSSWDSWMTKVRGRGVCPD